MLLPLRRLVRAVSLWGVVVGLLVFTTSGLASATSLNPLDDGGWHLVAHISNQGGMFDGNGHLASDYSYGAFVPNPSTDTPDFQRVFPVVAQEILFLSGDLSVWGIANYSDLRSIVTAQSGDYSPNIAFETGINGTISQGLGNVLSRNPAFQPEDPWVALVGSHHDGVNNQLIVWGENNFGAGGGPVLKNSHGGVNVFIRAVPEPNTALLLGIGLAGLGMRRRAH